MLLGARNSGVLPNILSEKNKLKNTKSFEAQWIVGTSKLSKFYALVKKRAKQYSLTG